MSVTAKTLPDIADVEERLHKVLASNLPDFLDVTSVSRSEVSTQQRFTGVSVFFIFLVLLALYVFRSVQGSPLYTALLIFLALWMIVMLFSGHKWLQNKKLLAREMNMALVSVLNSTLERTFMYTHNADHQAETVQLLKESNLMTVAELEIESDDMYTAYDDREVSFRELVVTQKVSSDDTKTNTPVTLFKGVFVVATLNRSELAETYISTENDKEGFAHRTFWSNVLNLGTVKETELEWNDFEKDLHVATSDPTAAREILTPDFMQHLHEWWLEHKLNIRIAFKQDKMYLLLPESSIHIQSTTTSTE